MFVAVLFPAALILLMSVAVAAVFGYWYLGVVAGAVITWIYFRYIKGHFKFL